MVWFWHRINAVAGRQNQRGIFCWPGHKEKEHFAVEYGNKATLHCFIINLGWTKYDVTDALRI